LIRPVSPHGVQRRAQQSGQHHERHGQHDRRENRQNRPEGLALVIQGTRPEIEEHDPNAIDRVKQHAGDQTQRKGGK
jgi:hypothetical protein